jgi:hypothetical protein
VENQASTHCAVGRGRLLRSPDRARSLACRAGDQGLVCPTVGALANVEVGDMCRLPRERASADAVLLLGPFYHLTERYGRRLAL